MLCMCCCYFQHWLNQLSIPLTHFTFSFMQDTHCNICLPDQYHFFLLPQPWGAGKRKAKDFFFHCPHCRTNTHKNEFPFFTHLHREKKSFFCPFGSKEGGWKGKVSQLTFSFHFIFVIAPFFCSHHHLPFGENAELFFLNRRPACETSFIVAHLWKIENCVLVFRGG